MTKDSESVIRGEACYLALRHLITSEASYLKPIELTKLVFVEHLGNLFVNTFTGLELSGPYAT
jgi:hypothetical protein